MNNLFKIIHKPSFFFSVREDDWIRNFDFLNKGDIVTQIDDLDALSLLRISESFGSGLLSDYYNVPCVTKTLNENIAFWHRYNHCNNKQEKIKFLKSCFHVFLVSSSQKTIIWKEFLKEI